MYKRNLLLGIVYVFTALVFGFVMYLITEQFPTHSYTPFFIGAPLLLVFVYLANTIGRFFAETLNI